jgi:hypothetical protein
MMIRSKKLSKGWLVAGLSVLAAGVAAPAYIAHVETAATTSVHAEVAHGGGDRNSAGWFIHY